MEGTKREIATKRYNYPPQIIHNALVEETCSTTTVRNRRRTTEWVCHCNGALFLEAPNPRHWGHATWLGTRSDY